MAYFTARITKVERNSDGSATLCLQILQGASAARLVVLDAPRHFEAAVGVVITGRDSAIYVRRELWANRVGLISLRLVKKHVKTSTQTPALRA